jgi:hypothetical protein
MGKQVMTQNEYERKHSKLVTLRAKLKDKKMTKDEVIDHMVVVLHYGRGRAKEIASGWSRRFCNSINTRRYNPNPIVKISHQERIMKAETDLGIDREML